MEAMQTLAVRLLRNGFTPIHISPDGKMPKHPGWQINVPTEEQLTRQFAMPSNIGVRLGDLHKDETALIAVDIDIEEHQLVRCVEFALGEKVPVKRGRKGYTYIFRVKGEYKTHKIFWTRDGKKTPAIDVLCKGAQTVIPPSIHPDTKQPYQWVAGTPLDQIDYRTLPVFTWTVIDEIRGFCKRPDDFIYALNDMEWRGEGGGGNTHDTCVQAVASMVGRKWLDPDIQERIQRAKREACERAGTPYNWPEADKRIQEWIDSSRKKNFDVTSKHRSTDVPVEILNRYVYVQGVNQMYDLRTGIMLDQQVFNNVHAPDIPRPWAAVTACPDRQTVHMLTYAPGQPRFCREKNFDSEAILDCLNTYQDPGVEPEEGDVSLFLDLVNHVFDHHKEAVNHVLSFFAHMLQHPGERINHGLVIQGEQGIGKDSIIHAIQKVIGTQNISNVSLVEVESQFNQWLMGKQLIVFQEMLAAGRRGIYNKLKVHITDPVNNINQKHLKPFRMANRAVYIFLTNYKHALSIDPSDRRTWVWYSQATPKDPEYYKAYYRWLDDRRTAGAVMHYLLNYDISRWNPAAPPPMTDAKRQMIEASSSEIEQFLRTAAEQRTWPMACDLINTQHLLVAVRGIMRVTENMINEALDHILPKGSKLEQRPWFGSARPRFRAIRNYEKWQDASGKEIRETYLVPLPPQTGETEGSYAKYGPENDGIENMSSDGPDF